VPPFKPLAVPNQRRHALTRSGLPFHPPLRQVVRFSSNDRHHRLLVRQPLVLTALASRVTRRCVRYTFHNYRAPSVSPQCCQDAPRLSLPLCWPNDDQLLHLSHLFPQGSSTRYRFDHLRIAVLRETAVLIEYYAMPPTTRPRSFLPSAPAPPPCRPSCTLSRDRPLPEPSVDPLFLLLAHANRSPPCLGYRPRPLVAVRTATFP